MARTRSVDFLPQIFQTPVNKQFLSATLDTLTQEPKFKKTQGFIGRSVGPGVNPNDTYVVEPTAVRRDYQLEPGVVSLEPEDTNTIKNVITYPGMNDAIGFQGGDSTRPDQLYNSDYYTWDPFIDYDTFINFSQYYWLPNGPDTVDVQSDGIPITENFVVTRANGVYTFSGKNGNNPTIDLVRGGNYTFQVAQNTKETVNLRVSNQGLSSYIINKQANPTLTLVRGNTYVFDLNLSGDYAFWIKTAQVLGTGNAYNSGVSRNGSIFGLVTFVVPQDAPDTLYYVSENQTNLRGTFNVIDGTPGTGNEFWIQSAPGVDGKSPTTPNISTRDVYGVTNNGEDLGFITFEVPQKTAQQFYFNLTDVGPVDLLTELKFDQINNQPVQEFLDTYGGIDGITYIEGRTLVFTNTEIDPDTGGWLDTSFFDPLNAGAGNNGLPGSFDTVPFDQTTVIPFEDRYQIWQINFVDRNGVQYIQLAKIQDVAINEKFNILYGITWSNTGWYKNATNTLTQIPLLTANLDTLYYQDGTDPDIFGRIRLIEQANVDTIDIDDILGRKNYTSPTGVVFTNGLKVRFLGQVTPASYGSGITDFNCTATIAGSNYITTASTDGLYEGEQIIFPGATIGGIETGRVYYIKSISANRIQFSISTVVDGAAVQLSTVTGNMPALASSNREYYVAGVGTAIELLPVTNFITPEAYVVDANDSTIASEPDQLDYLTISRASKDLNAWTRSNRWFHTDVIQATAEYNRTTPTLDNNYRAKRPIIQFRPGIRLFNMGTEGKQPVDIIDFDQTDAFSNIQGSTGYTVNGYTVVDGTRIVFAADLDPAIRNKIYTVQFIEPDSLPLTTAGNFALKATYRINTLGSTDWNAAAGTTGITYSVGDTFIAANSGSGTGTAYFDEPIINLVLAADGIVLYDQSVVCLEGTGLQGLTFWYNGESWTQAQLKTGVQQAPLFDAYDLAGVSFNDPIKYPSSTFTGTKLFSYAVGDTGLIDVVLKFPLQYLNINNVGDIVFENNLYVDTFLYVQDNVSITSDISSGSAREYADRITYAKLIGWQDAITTSQIYQQFKFTYTGATLKLDVAVSSNTLVPAVKIYVGSKFQQPTAYSYTTTSNSTTITLNNVYLPTDVIEVLVLSEQTSKDGFYQVPINLESNPLNGNSPSFTLGTIRTHYESICENLTDLTGPVNGANNSRDLGNIVPYGLIILQQSAPLTLAGYFLRSEQFNIFSSLQYNSQEYLKFKGQMLNAATQQTIQFQTASAILDAAIADITVGRVESQPFYWSDMLPVGSIYTTSSYTISYTSGTSFPTQQVYDYTSANYLGMNVYVNNNLLTRDYDYVVATDGPRITITSTLNIGDVVTIQEYSATYGNFVPNTPTKLGLYPAYRPRYIEQKTSTGTVPCILGHDGSITRKFNDIRDEVLLEFEKRIYNNLKLDGNPVPLTIYDVLPGQFRSTGYSINDINNILSQDFLSYVAWNKLDYRTQDYQANNEFTWNYSGSESKLDNEPLPGAWRGIYRYYYDTQQPEQTPWEMLGFSIEPSWWQEIYGPAPYTQDNLVLWDDLELGRVADPAGNYFLPEFARPGLTSVIPTGTEGELLSPFDSVVGTYNAQTFRKSWAIGDGGPTEASWWNSSAYPFAVMRLLALTRPGKFFALFADRDLYKFDVDLNQYVYNGRYRLNAKDIEVYGNGVSKASYIDWIVDFNRQSGLNSTTELTADLEFLDVRLCYRMASFSDKQYIKIYTEKSSPNSINTTLLIPDESYNLVLYKNQPFDRVSYSSVVIQKTAGGYAVFGYNKTQPFFNTIGSLYTGQLETFTSGGVTVKVPTFYTDQIVQIPYGYVFANETAVSAFLLGYGEYLERQGLLFDDATNGYILTWGQMVNEFLYWSQQGWDDNALINLNPLAFKLSVTKPQAVVDSIAAQTSDNVLLDQNNRELPTRNLIITRLDNTFVVEPATDQTLSSIDLKYTSYEHMIVLNNTSSFGDLIYQTNTGARQSRLNLIAYTSTEWNGSVDAQGFILNQDNIKPWNSYTTYTKGEIVSYKGAYWSAADIVQPSVIFNANDWYQSDYTRIELGLLPNLANKADQLADSYNINRANLESDNDLLSYGLIGFRPRQYMASLNLDDVSQLNVYRQFLGSKGTILSAELFGQATFGKESGDYTIYENWAVQRAVYGANANRSFFQLRLNRALLSSNPSIVQVVDSGEPSQADQTIFLNDVWRQSYRLTSPDILPTTTTLPTDIALPTAGYVNINDVDITVFDINNVDSLAANIDSINVGTTIWVAKTNAYDWNIYRASAVPGVIAHVCDNLDGTSRVIFTQQHGLSVGDKLIIKFFDAEVNGVYDVLNVSSLDTLSIAFSFTGDRTVVDGTGIGFTLATQRVAQASDIINLPYANTLQPGAKVWVDNNGSGLWETVQKEEVFTALTELAPVLTDVDQQYGSSVAQSRDKFAALVGSPRFRFPAGATLWDKANNYLEDSIVYVVDPYQTEFFIAAAGSPLTPAPVPQGIDIYNTAYWTPYSLSSLPRKGGVYVYVKGTATDQYIPISPLTQSDAVLTLDVLDVSGGPNDGTPAARGYGSSVDFGSKAWAVAGAPNSLGSLGQADNGYACVIYLAPDLGAPDTVPYGQWQLLTTPDSVSVDQGKFGYSVAMSLDERWMYIGAPAVNKVYAYGRVDWTNQVINTIGDGETTVYGIADVIQIDEATQLEVLVGGAEQTLNVDFTVNGSFTEVTFVTAPTEGTAVQLKRTSRKIMDYGVFYGVTQTSTSGSGVNAEFTIIRQRNEVGQANAPAATAGLVAVSNPGSGYLVSQTVTIDYTKFGGASANGSIVLTITSVNGSGGITGYSIYYNPTVLTNVFSLNEYFFTATDIYSFSVLVDDVLQRPFIDYTFSSVTQDLTFVNSPARGTTILVRSEGYFEYADTITVAGLGASDQFGYSVSTSTDGRQVLIGTPYSTQDSKLTAGSVYVFDRNVQTFIYGTDPSSVSFTVLGSVTEPVSVLVNGVFLVNEVNSVLGAANTFTVSGNTVTINADLQVGDVIEIETNQFAQVQEISQSTTEATSHFGSAVDLCSYNCSLYAGAPNSSAQQFQGGIVERNINQSRAYGIITATVANPVLTSGDTIRIDNIDVAVPSSPNQNVAGLAAAINAAIPNVNATVSVTGYLTLAVKNYEAASVGNKLQVAPGSVGTTFDDLGFETFVYTQTIESPYPQSYAQFGASLSIDDSAVNLVVGAPNGTMYIPTDFDNYTALWDAGASEFFDLLFQSGTVYTYDLLPSSSGSISNPDKFVFGQQIVNSDISPYDRYGTAVSYTSGVLLSGAPGNELDDSTMSANYGRVFVSENPNLVPSWTVRTLQQPVVDIRLLNSVYAYDRITSATATYFDFFDPLQGKILGAARQNLDYIGAIDPANYNVGPVNILGNTWTSLHVGETWWDTSTVRFIDPNQDDIVYASRRWGQVFPGSTVDVYQWIVSDAPPANYVGEGIPRDTLSYAINTVLTQTGNFVTEYYFWVRGITTTATQKGKTLPVSTVASYIADPRASGIAYVAPINSSTIALYNATDYIVAEDTILSIEFDRELTENNVHVEYELVPQDKANGWISNNLYRKMQDSFCGVDTAGNLVPDINLSPAERYGVQFRPRQSMFVDRFEALKNYLVRANTVMAQYPIAENRIFVLLNSKDPEPSATSGEWNKRVANLEILGFQDLYAVPVGYKYLVDSDSRNGGLWTIYTVGTTTTSAGDIRSLTLTKVQNYNTPQYWSYINWYLPGYNSSAQVVAETPNYAGLSTINVPVGSSVKVTANALGKFEIYIRTLTGWDRVGLQDGTIEFSAQLWDYALGRFGYDIEVFDAQYFDQEPVIETRKIIQAINEEIFVDELLIERNRQLTLLFNFVLSEFSAPGWVLKTSLIDVEHRIRSLLPYQNYSRDNQEFVLDYIQEVKPYHVQVKAFNLIYNGFNEWFGDMTDFDLPAYYNTSLTIPGYTSPILLPYDHGNAVGSTSNTQSDLPSDSTVWSSWPYSQWYNNYALHVDSVEVIEGGSGYTEPPIVEFVGTTDDPAQAVAVLNSQGTVVAINLIYAGSGYTATPTITLDGTGTGARVYARMINDVVRQFRTVIKYDRFQYQTVVQNWDSNGTYENGTLVRYDDRVWSALNADGSSAVVGPTFDIENWVPVNAATYTYPGSTYPTGLSGVDRTMGLYVPGVNEPGLELPLLVNGVDYPGVQVWGKYFTGTETLDANYQSEFADIYLGTQFSDINVDGGEFIGPYEGHAPEELINGAEYDTLDMRIYTRPGSDWTGNGHGFQINSINYTYEPAITQIYRWAGVSTHPAQVLVANLTTGSELTKDIDYFVNWAEQTVEIVEGVSDQQTINIGVYELGGGNQLFRGNYTGQEIIDSGDNSIIIPVNYKEIAQIVVFQNGENAAQPAARPYAVSIPWNINNSYSTLDVVYNDNEISCTTTGATYNFITCNNTIALVIGQPIVFSGTVFGGIVADTTYYVLDIANGTQFSVTAVAGSGTAVTLLDDTGTMTGSPTGTYYRAIQSMSPGILLTNNLYWLPFVPTLNTKVTFAQEVNVSDGLAVVPLGVAWSFPVTGTTTGTNAITVQGNTNTLSVGQQVSFSGDSLGGIVAGVAYYVLAIVNANSFTIEAVLGSGTPVSLLTDSATWTGELNAKFIPTDFDSWSTPVVDNFIVDETTYITKTFTGSNSLGGTNPANIIVMQNKLRLRPPEGIEWIGDDSTVSFGLPQRGGYSQEIIDPPTNISVWVDNVFQVQSVGATIGTYSVTNWDGSNVPGRQVVFNTAPAAGATILISVDVQADYTVINNQVQLSTNVNIGDVISVISWNDTAQQDILTLVFDGPIQVGLVINEPYDSTTFDSGTVDFSPGSYDYTTGTAVSINDFDLQRPVSSSRLWVTLDGYRLFDGADFTVQGQYLILATGVIPIGSILVVTEFTESVVPEAAAFRIFQDMRGVQATYRMTTATTTTLAQPLSATADIIYVVDASKLSEPELAVGIFGVITIDGERIMYRNRNTALNTVSGLRRGTAGTGAAAHVPGTEVYDIGIGNLLAEQYQDYVVKDSGMGDGTTTVFYAPNIDISDFGDSSTAYVESIEVYVGGTRQYNYSETAGNSEYRYIVTDFGPLAIEFVVDGTYLAPAAGSEVTILQRRGKSWYEPGNGTASNGVALQETNTIAARFLCDR